MVWKIVDSYISVIERIISYFKKKIEVELTLTQECMFMFIIYYCILDILCITCVEKLDPIIIYNIL